MPGVSDFSCGRATLRPGMISRFAASDSVTAPCRTLSQSSSVLGTVSTVPLALCTVVTAFQT